MKSTGGKFGSNLVAGVSQYGPDAHAPTFRPKGLNAWVLNLTVSGRGRVNRGEHLFHVETCDLLLFPPQVVHDYSWEPGGTDWVHLWIYFSPSPQWASLLHWPRRTGGVLGFALKDKDAFSRVREAMERCREMYRSPLHNRLRLCGNYLEEALLWCDTQNPFSQGSGGDERIARVVAYMMREFAAPLDASDLARQAQLSVSRFSHLFRETTGVPPLRYLESLRIWKAQELLIGSSKSIKEISQEAGFRDPLYFSKVFRRNLGASPRRFRRESRED